MRSEDKKFIPAPEGIISQKDNRCRYDNDGK